MHLAPESELFPVCPQLQAPLPEAEAFKGFQLPRTNIQHSSVTHSPAVIDGGVAAFGSWTVGLDSGTNAGKIIKTKKKNPQILLYT